jgi:hypothetical protein
MLKEGTTSQPPEGRRRQVENSVGRIQAVAGRQQETPAQKA